MVVICPSNPLISIDPILTVRGMRDALRACRAPVVAVSPIIGGKAVKGPTAKMMAELGLPVEPRLWPASTAISSTHYVIDEADAGPLDGVDVPIIATRTLMRHHGRPRGTGARGAGDRPKSSDDGFVGGCAGQGTRPRQGAPRPVAASRHAPGVGAGDARRRAGGACRDCRSRRLHRRYADPAARRLALRYGMRIVEDGARDGHTGAVTAAARLLAAEGSRGHADLAGRHPAGHRR